MPAQVTHDVACLARWMAADLYLKEIDALRFELSMNHASDEVGAGGGLRGLGERGWRGGLWGRGAGC